MKIGILKEESPENRVAVTPESVTAISRLKAEVWVEKSAGMQSFITDAEYEEAGAAVVSREKVTGGSDLLIFINPPKELKSVRNNQILLGMLNPFSNKDLVKTLVSNGVTSFSMELVPRISRAQSMDVLSSMATVAGYKAILEAAYSLPRFFPMFMSAAGTVKPAKVLILGAGVAGLQAIAIARKLGAVVEVFDVRAAVKEEVASLGGKFIEVEGAREDASAGGYAVEQTEGFRQKQLNLIHEHALRSDVIVCTAQIPGKKAPVLLTKETVEKMKAGSLIIDLASSTGGNCELTEDNKTKVHKNVRITGNSNYASSIPSDASSMYSRNILNFLKLLIDEQGNLNLDFEDEVIKGTCLTRNGELVNQRVKELLNI